MADELKENVTTPWMQKELTAEEISRDDQAGENTGFWILRGKGSGRDRFINLKNLRVWIQAAVDAVAYIKDNGISGIKKALSFEFEGKKTEVEAGRVTFSDESGVNAVLRDSGIWFEYTESGVHAFVSEDGFGYHYVDDNGGAVEVELGKNGLFLGDGIQIINGLSNLKSLSISDTLKIAHDGSLVMTGIFSAQESGFVVRTDFKVGEVVEILQNGNVRTAGSVDANVLNARRTVNGTAFCSSIFDATEQSILLYPGSLLGAVALAGATALVRNATGRDVVISRSTGSTSNLMTLIVRPEEILRYVYDGYKWVHSW